MIIINITATEEDTQVILDSANAILIHLDALQNKERPDWPITKDQYHNLLNFYCSHFKPMREEVRTIIDANKRNLTRHRGNL